MMTLLQGKVGDKFFLKDIIETQDNLLKEMKQRVTYSQLDTAVYPIKEKIDLIEKTLELKSKKKP